MNLYAVVDSKVNSITTRDYYFPLVYEIFRRGQEEWEAQVGVISVTLSRLYTRRDRSIWTSHVSLNKSHLIDVFVLLPSQQSRQVLHGSTE